MPPSDLLLAPAAIAARAIGLGAPLAILDATDSTNDDAKRAAKAGAPHGATWVAESQRQGRGRQGRAWLAAPGDALLFSVLARVTCAPSRLPPLSLVAGLAVRDAVARAAPDANVRLKWPNDVVVGAERRKVAGILVEASLAGSRVDAVVVGVGVNVHTRAFPPEIVERATSVALVASARPNRAELLADVLAGLDRDLALVAARGLGAVHGRLVAADALRGERVKSETGEGIAEGIDADGRLLVRADDGTFARWSAGEVHLVA